ncbi:MAG: PLP-dependent aminotransferase family protein [Gammaproteobacteria bacterium]|nr:PLP-dependent aminotransferase family protein [Gammaproteobacteria bacterium]
MPKERRSSAASLINLQKYQRGKALYRSLFEQIRDAILEGAIAGGVRLPSSRELAGEMSLSRNTVKAAYELLSAEGYITSSQGVGSFVVDLPDYLRLQKPDKRPISVTPRLSGLALRVGDQTACYFEGSMLLQPAVPALDHFPRKKWRSCLGRAADRSALESQPLAGDRRLRKEIASYLAVQRGIQVDLDQIMVTSGSQQGLYFAASLLVEQGESLLLESPGFPGTEAVLRAAGANPKLLSWNQLQMGDLDEDAGLLCLTPSRNFPLGHALPLEARLSLLRWAEARDAWIIEDDYDSEFAAGAPITALYALSREQRVIYAGTFSRSMYPGLRLGYLVLPKSLVNVFIQARRLMDGGLSILPQVALADFMAQGMLSRHLRKMRKLYRMRRRVMEERMNRGLLSRLSQIDAGGGMHMVLQLPIGLDDVSIAKELAKQGVGVRPLSGYSLMSEALSGLVVGFAADDEIRMERGVSIMEGTLGNFQMGLISGK